MLLPRTEPVGRAGLRLRAVAAEVLGAGQLTLLIELLANSIGLGVLLLHHALVFFERVLAGRSREVAVH